MAKSVGLLNGVNIAFVDDEPYYVRAYRDRLTHASANVVFYDNIVDAAAAIDGGKTFDAVILDLMMPHENVVDYATQDKLRGANGLHILTKQNLARRVANRQTALVILTNANELLPDWDDNSPVTKALHQTGIDPASPHITMRTKLDLSAKDAPRALHALLRNMGRAA